MPDSPAILLFEEARLTVRKIFLPVYSVNFSAKSNCLFTPVMLVSFKLSIKYAGLFFIKLRNLFLSKKYVSFFSIPK